MLRVNEALSNAKDLSPDKSAQPQTEIEIETVYNCLMSCEKDIALQYIRKTTDYALVIRQFDNTYRRLINRLLMHKEMSRTNGVTAEELMMKLREVFPNTVSYNSYSGTL